MPALFTRTGSPFNGRVSQNDKGQIGYWINTRTCPRCGGAGGADKWKFTGWTCFECDGKRVVPCERFGRLYSADELAKLNARAAKADATREAKRVAAAAAEAARIERERAAVVEAHAELLARIAAVTDVTAEGFLADMYNQVVERARPLSDAQRAAVEKTVAAFEAERARKAVAAHVGTVGERVELELSFVRRFDITEGYYGAPVRYVWTFRDAAGNTIIYYGGNAKALDALPSEVIGEGRDAYRQLVKGGTVRIAATIKSHGEYKGEPQTVIQRPKAL